MTNSTPQSLLERLDSSDAETVLMALRTMNVNGEIAPFLPKLVELLQVGETDLRWLVAYKLNEAASRGHDIQVAISALETLSDDEAVPSWIAKSKPVNTVWVSVGCQAVSTATHHYRHRRDGAALGRLIAAGGLVAARALNALRWAEHADEIAMVMPLVLEQLSKADDTVRLIAAGLLTKYYFLARHWDAIADLLDSETERVRRGALVALDDLAEAEKYDLTPVVPCILRVFARKGGDYKKTRVAAAGVLVWFILQQDKTSATSFVLNGVDLMRIAEVRAKLRRLKRFAAKHSDC